MDGWGRRYIVVSPDGLVLPCHYAHTLPGIRWESVKDVPLETLWKNGAGMNAFRGKDWMPSPCRECDRRDVDFGGCRCQAYHLTGNAAVTDPACRLSPHHGVVQAAGAGARGPRVEPKLIELRYRTFRHGRVSN
jgi:pyrroloquinoline quinone biosynthesis protein E